MSGRALTPRLPRLLPTRTATPARRPAHPLTEGVPRPCQGGRAVPTAHTPDVPSLARQASLDRSSASGGTPDGLPPPPTRIPRVRPAATAHTAAHAALDVCTGLQRAGASGSSQLCGYFSDGEWGGG